ncbi:MAG: hypothetical protein HYU37_07745 [Acidobacteria bacterium]|nr:hypothetical protein [Acidobacteriota bacterium]
MSSYNSAPTGRGTACSRHQHFRRNIAADVYTFSLPAWRRRAKVKEVASPKFHLFDPGVARALAGRVREPLEGLERGFLLETHGGQTIFVSSRISVMCQSCT